MRKRVIAVVVVTLVALVPTFLWVPAVECFNFTRHTGSRPDEPTLIRVGAWYRNEAKPLPRWGWTWARFWRAHPDSLVAETATIVPAGATPVFAERIHWPWVLFEQAFVLMLGGGLMTLVVRRGRRRKADSTEH